MKVYGIALYVPVCMGAEAETMTKLVPVGRSRPISRALRLHDTIARDLGVAITSGKYQPGDLLIGEIASSVKLEVSRTAYREAVRILSAKGLVEAKPKVGTKVSLRSKWHMLDPDVLSWMFENEPDLALLESLFELRNIVEPAAAALAAIRRTSKDLDAMRDGIERIAYHTLATEAGRKGDADFHASMLQATCNPYIISLATGVNAAVKTTTVFKQRERPLPRDPVPDHLRVFQAIADRNPDRAQREMSTLIALAFRDIPLSQRAGETARSRKGTQAPHK